MPDVGPPPSNAEAGKDDSRRGDECAAVGAERVSSPGREGGRENTAASRSWFRRGASAAWKIALALALIPVLQVAALRVVNPPFTAMMLYQALGNLLHGRPAAWRHENLPRDQISPWLLKAILAGEDQRFFEHGGFDFVEIENARQDHRRSPGQPLRGASTLTQQVAKNLFLPPWHSFVRKGVEAYYTWLLELIWPKNRILLMYANIAEFAPNVYGAQAAARHHFRKDAARLSRHEAALLAAVLPNPKRWNASRPTPFIQERAEWIEEQIPQVPMPADTRAPSTPRPVGAGR